MKNRKISRVDRVALAAIFAATTVISVLYGFTATAAPHPELVAAAVPTTPPSGHRPRDIARDASAAGFAQRL